MPKRIAVLYNDGSFNVGSSTDDIETEKHRLGFTDDPGNELVEVEITVVRRLGKPELKAIHETTCKCPTCGEVFEP